MLFIIRWRQALKEGHTLLHWSLSSWGKHFSGPVGSSNNQSQSTCAASGLVHIFTTARVSGTLFPCGLTGSDWKHSDGWLIHWGLWVTFTAWYLHPPHTPTTWASPQQMCSTSKKYWIGTKVHFHKRFPNFLVNPMTHLYFQPLRSGGGLLPQHYLFCPVLSWSTCSRGLQFWEKWGEAEGHASSVTSSAVFLVMWWWECKSPKQP